jgi:hypothetical protein
MKIHLLPPLPVLPPVTPKKTPPTTFDIEQMTEELVETAQYWRTQRGKLAKIRKNSQRSNQGAEASKSAPRERRREDAIDVLA